MKSLVAIATAVVFASPALAEQAKPAKKPATGSDYDLLRRDRRASVPRADVAAAKVATVTEAMVAKVAKVRHGEIEYCWERLPPSQRVAGTALLHFAIAPDGAVAAVEVHGDAPRAAASCIADVAHDWTFPAVEAQSVVDYPIRLRDR